MKPLVSFLARKGLIRSTLALVLLSAFTPLTEAHAIDPTVRIAIAYDLGGLGDGGVNDAAALGIKSVRAKYQLSPLVLREVVTLGTEADRLERLKFLAKAGYNLVIAVGKSWSTAVAAAASEYPESQFAIIGGTNIDALNVSVMDFSHKEESYLAGALAAASSKSGKIGFIDESSDQSAALDQEFFRAGAKFIRPSIKITNAVIATGGSTQVKNMVASGVDVIYSRWSTNSDVFTTVVNASKKARVSLIGIQPEQYFLSSTNAKKILLATIVENYGLAISQLVTAALNNETILDSVDPVLGSYGRLYSMRNSGIAIKNFSATSAAIVKAKSSLARLK